MFIGTEYFVPISDRSTAPASMEAMSSQDRPRGRKREAMENDRVVLEAAREVFAQRGWQAPMSAIAERAGVGVASIYRRYPGKDDLVRELRVRALESVNRIALAALPGDGSAVGRFLRAHIRETATPLVVAFGRQFALTEEISELSERLRLALEEIIAHDVKAHLVPRDFTPADLLLGLTHLRPALPTSTDRATEHHLRHLEIYLLGLEAAATGPGLLSGRGAEWDEWLALHDPVETEGGPGAGTPDSGTSAPAGSGG